MVNSPDFKKIQSNIAKDLLGLKSLANIEKLIVYLFLICIDKDVIDGLN
jgi:hypothetical protein